MNISQEIKYTFFALSENSLSDEFIENNSNPMELDPNIDAMVYVPAYILWCIKHGEKDGNLVCSYTLNCLAEFGRSKNAQSEFFNFKYRCNTNQKEAIVTFLKWCLSNFELCNIKQIERIIERWQ